MIKRTCLQAQGQAGASHFKPGFPKMQTRVTSRSCKMSLARLFLSLLVLSLLVHVAVTRAQEDGDEFPPYTLIEANLKATDITVAIEITEFEKEQNFEADDKMAGYVIYRIKARVLRRYKGAIRQGSALLYRYLMEAGINPPKAGTRQIVSLRKNADQLVIPGVGYAFEYSDRLDELYEKAAGKQDAESAEE